MVRNNETHGHSVVNCAIQASAQCFQQTGAEQFTTKNLSTTVSGSYNGPHILNETLAETICINGLNSVPTNVVHTSLFNLIFGLKRELPVSPLSKPVRIKKDLKPRSGPRVFGCARWRKDMVKVSSELARYRRAWVASISDQRHSISDTGSTSSTSK